MQRQDELDWDVCVYGKVQKERSPLTFGLSDCKGSVAIHLVEETVGNTFPGEPQELSFDALFEVSINICVEIFIWQLNM